MFALKYMDSTWNFMVLLKIIYSKTEEKYFLMLLSRNDEIQFYTSDFFNVFCSTSPVNNTSQC